MIKDSETFGLLLDQINRLVKQRLIPNEHRLSEDDQIPDEIVREMRDLGLFGLSIPREYGGLELTLEETLIVVATLCRAAPAYRSYLAGNVGVGAHTIMIGGTSEQKRKYLPDIASGKSLVAFGLTEPEAGSDAASLRARAVRRGDHYVINGTKRFITNSPDATLYLVMARTGGEGSGAGGISCFFVERGTAGLSTGRPMKKMGQQGAKIADVILDDVRVPIENLVGAREGAGFTTAMKVLDRGRLHIAAVALGIAERAQVEAVRYTSERQQFGRALASFQLVQAMLADNETEIYAARSMIFDAAQRFDVGEQITREASCCKLFASEMCGRVVDRTVQVHGGSGYVAEFAAERLFRDARVLRIYEGASEIQRLVIARELLKDHAVAS
jgi:acyl-CoA dehydrogenase